MSKLSVKRYHDAGVRIGDVEIAIGVRRMPIEEFVPWEREYFKWAAGGGVEDEILEPVPGEEEMEPEQILVARRKAAEHRLARRSPAQKKEDEARLIKRADELQEWVRKSVVENVVFKPGEVDFEGEPVESGEQIYRVFGTNLRLMMACLNHLWAENKLPDATKKNSSSGSGSRPGSPMTPETGEAGGRPGPTAESAGPSGSVGTADATPERPPAES